MQPSKHYPRITIAGLGGGSGKTTLSLGLIAGWRGTGLKIITYKKGPDYIDAGWLSSASGRNCYNLDPFLIGRERILSSFMDHFGDADCAVVEGNRGFYDGVDSLGTYSTAELSKILKSPVLLILDCTKMTRTAAALVLGVQKFDRQVTVKGIVLNRIAGARHEKIIRESVERYCGIPVLGCIPKLRDLVSERHMGLIPCQEHPDTGNAISRAAEIGKNYLDLARIREIAYGADKLPKGQKQMEKAGAKELGSPSAFKGEVKPLVAIGIIKDSAFQFYYPENFEELEKRGAALIEISAVAEKDLPEIDALYIGGGFPETNAIALAKNTRFKGSLKRAVENGLPVYAECGGLMYLGNSLILNGKSFPMTGVFPVSFRLEKKPQAHGYTMVKVGRKNPFYTKGTQLKGHEFHYSLPVIPSKSLDLKYSFEMERGHGIANCRDGLSYKNVLATYTHLHAYGAPEWADALIRLANKYKKERTHIGRKK